MSLIDRDIAECRALVVDANPTSRSILAAQLRDFGVVNVTQASRVTDARRALEVRPFDIVLCEQYFTAEGATGQDLLDDLRRANLLPYSTVFVMITGESSYDKVADAAESALDSYLLKPHTAAALGERLRQSRHRKRELAPIFDAVEQEQFDEAARLCLRRFHDRAPYWLYAARIGAELLLRLEKPALARQLYQAVIDAQALPWAKLGIARAQVDEGQPKAALRTLEALLTAHPGHTDAYDVMGRVQVEQGQLAQALDTFRLASAATPHSIARLQKQGLLAYYQGEHDEAAKALDRAALLGISSKLFDPQSLVVLGFVRFAQRDGKGLQRCLDNLLHAAERDPDNLRLARLCRVLQTLQSMLQHQVAAALAKLREMTQEIGAEAFDVEAACNLLALLAQLTAAEVQLDETDAHIDALALRFVTSRGMTELLARAASAHAPHEQRVRGAQQRITQLAEASLAHALAGDARGAVTALIAHAGSTGNTKLIDTARGTLARYHDKIADADDLAQHIVALRTRYAAGATALPLGQAQGRATGGVVLRAAA